MKNQKSDKKNKTDSLLFDVVVCGGGLAGFSAAIASARQGVKTCLIQDRPVFGGNSSSEIRVTPHGAAAFHAYGRETGIISELLIEERHKNHEPILENGWTNSVWDLVLLDLAISTPNLTFFLNTQVYDVGMGNSNNIVFVKVRVSNAEKEFIIHGNVFIDSTGDGLVAHLAGCEYRMGTESSKEFSELHAPTEATDVTMGSSLHFKAKDMGELVPFEIPAWANKLDNPDFFYKQGRIPKTIEGGYWWIELSVPWNTIFDNDNICLELTRYVLGIWDWIKNKDPILKEKAKNYGLDWIGQVPGKRESRRIAGLHLLTENDLSQDFRFMDEVAYGGWFVDLHTPGGLLAQHGEPTASVNYDPTADVSVKSYIPPYGIPLRCLIAKDVKNLMMAGRNISVTHAAFGSIRVMGTLSIIGQAAGTTAAIAIKAKVQIHDMPEKEIKKIQQSLLREGCFLPHIRNEDPNDLAQKATVNASSEENLSGVGLLESSDQRQVGVWLDQPQGPWVEYLNTRTGQVIPVNTDAINKISVCLSNHSNHFEEVQVEVLPINSIWDYSSKRKPLASGVLRVPPGNKHWVDWHFVNNLSTSLKSLIRLDLLQNPNVEWHKAKTVKTGCVAMYEIAPGKMRRYQQGVTLTFKISPEQPCYESNNVINGIARPYDYTNAWRSNPKETLPQWIELCWTKPQEISRVEISFDCHLLREYHAYPPLFDDPSCVRDYQIVVPNQSGWQIIEEVSGNYQRRRTHDFSEPIITKQLRINVLATNGEKSASIYEIRCY